MKRTKPPHGRKQWQVCAVELAVPSPHAAHRLHGQALGSHWLREYLVHDLSREQSSCGICSEVKLRMCWHTALRNVYILLLVLPNIHLPCSHTCQEVLSAVG